MVEGVDRAPEVTEPVAAFAVLPVALGHAGGRLTEAGGVRRELVQRDLADEIAAVYRRPRRKAR